MEDERRLTHAAAVLKLVTSERIRQEDLRAAGKFTHTNADPFCPDAQRMAIVAEEFGEVGKALLELLGAVTDVDPSVTDRTEKLAEELVHLAAVTVAWREAIMEGAGI